MNQIILMNAMHKKVGTLILKQDGTMEISVVDTFARLEANLRLLGETISKTEFYRKRSVDKQGAVIQLQEKVEKGQNGYINAIADFINSHAELVQPRVFAVVSEEA